MAAFGWQREKSVHEWLFTEAYRFDFFQAVRLLELIFPESAPVGEGGKRTRMELSMPSHGNPVAARC